ncbi:hypothetical protein HZZ00_00810 [Streptomyces sp. NEAU-sy36]|uniref:hypothetical protein n=1 Tax=unclassified Streptomyces TaxID=2593676 RepID=UPI0015D5C5B1|nr:MULTISPECIES: hypothetical protein [unclassified Streptomyces]QLI99658.1 hypothetical protein HZZ00_00810 [Streptomyces sp. NEAU-sy36]
MSLDAINAVDWSAIPNPTGSRWDDPEDVARALRLLTVSTTANETGDAAARLAGRGFVCGHAAMVFPAAYAATPILLDLVEHGRRPRIRDAALGLLADALDCFPIAGHNRVDTPYGTDVPLCCAIARHIRGRRGALLAHGKYGGQLLAQAELHWWLTIEETEPHPHGTVTVLATLEGTPFGTPVEAELHSPLSEGPAAGVRIDALTVDASGAVCAQLHLTQSELLPDSALCPAECGRREH